MLLRFPKVVNEETLLQSDQETSAHFPDNTNDFPQFFDNKFPEHTASFEKSEEIRIDKAFKRQDSNTADTFVIDDLGDLKSSTSLHGISNPNYGSSPSSSKTSLENFPFQMSVTPPHEPYKQSNVSYRKPGIKKASLFAWMTLQSVPEETIISPHILEFLEQSLELIPSKTNFNTPGKICQCLL